MASDEHEHPTLLGKLQHALRAVRDPLKMKANVCTNRSKPLVFRHPPTGSVDDDVPVHQGMSFIPNEGPFPLLEGAVENAEILGYQSWLLQALRQVEDLADSYPLFIDQLELGCLREEIIERLSDLEITKGEEWERQRALLITMGACERAGIPIFRLAPNPPSVTHSLFFACYMLLTVVHIICAVSVHRCNKFILPVFKLVLNLHEQYLLQTEDAEGLVSDTIPGSIQRVTSLLKLEPVIMTFVCCKSCFACYDPDSHPRHCTYIAAPDLPPCGRSLTCKRNRKGKKVTEPERQMHCQDFRSWLGELLSRPGMEELLDRDPYDTGAKAGELRDVWDGKVLRDFCGADGKNFFTQKEPGEIRLAFSLCEDNFNPFFNKHGGKSYSAGVICLICHNLPPDIRYLLENVFIFCVFPGPKEPKLEQINNVMTFLVDVFCTFWDPGVYYASTPRYPRGRLAKAAIVLVLADLIAARKISGIGKWCTQCPMIAMDIDNLKPETWPAPRSGAEHRQLAEEWKGLDSKARTKHFSRHGIRWSELLRLPYFDMPKFTAIELSHNLLTNCADHHLRSLWDMDASVPDGLGERETHLPNKKKEAHPRDVEHAWQIVNRGTKEQLEQIPAFLLAQCCRLAGEPNGGRKVALLEALHNWRAANGVINEIGLPVNPLETIKPGDPPTEYERYKAEEILANARSSKALMRIRRKVVEDLISSRIAEDGDALQRMQSLLDKSGGLSTARSDSLTASHASGSVESIHLSLAASSKETVSEALFVIETARRAKGKVRDQEKDDPHRSAVLGEKTLACIREDIQRITLPSWIGRVPSDLGAKAHGTLSQDALRTTVTVILVSSLPRIWGSEPVESRLRKMLTNFLDFSVATDIALMRSTSLDAIDECYDLLLKYLRGARDLYPHRGLIPNQHMTLHLRDTLKNHGPAPGQRTNLLERINFLLQKTNTNSKSGEMELTMIKRICMSQQIRASMARLPPDLKTLKDSFMEAFESDRRGTLQSESGGYFDSSITYSNRTTLETIPSRLYSLLCEMDSNHIPPRTALFQSSFQFRRASYSTASSGRADSYIIFGQYPLGRWHAGQITDVMVQENWGDNGFKVHIAVRHFRQLTEEDSQHDFYLAQRRGGTLGDIGRLFYSKKSKHTTLIDVKDIVCHCALNPVPVAGVADVCVHIRPLFRGGIALD